MAQLLSLKVSGAVTAFGCNGAQVELRSPCKRGGGGGGGGDREREEEEEAVCGSRGQCVDGDRGKCARRWCRPVQQCPPWTGGGLTDGGSGGMPGICTQCRGLGGGGGAEGGQRLAAGH